MPGVNAAHVDRDELRRRISDKYAEVASDPRKGFHFHTGTALALMLGYDEREFGALPPSTVESFAGVGNPFSMGQLRPGETVLDIGCGAGFDTLIAAQQVGSTGRVVAVDMTEAMLARARAGADELHLRNVEVRQGHAESLPAADASVDVVISNGVVNLTPDKHAVLLEIFRVLKPGGRLQIADVIVEREVPQDAKDDIDLWSG